MCGSYGKTRNEANTHIVCVSRDREPKNDGRDSYFVAHLPKIPAENGRPALTVCLAGRY